MGALLASQEVLPAMRKAKHGNIVFVGATASLRGKPKTSAFASARGGSAPHKAPKDSAALAVQWIEMIPISGLPLHGLTRFRELHEQKSVAPVPPVNPVERHNPHAHGFERESQPAAHVSISPEGRALAELTRERYAEAEEG